MIWVDKNLCVGCGMCVDVCPDGFEVKDEISVVKDPNASCITEAISACPVEAIKSDTEDDTRGQTQPTVPIPGVGQGGGRGKGKGRGMGRGMGIGPRDGRGRGRGGGGRRR